jgi:hypothetical protein
MEKSQGHGPSHFFFTNVSRMPFPFWIGNVSVAHLLGPSFLILIACAFETP